MSNALDEKYQMSARDIYSARHVKVVMVFL